MVYVKIFQSCKGYCLFVLGLITPCWGDGLDGGPYVADYPNHGTAEILNPMDEYVYDVMREIYTEIVDDFPDEYVHLGMDEVYYSCWSVTEN